MTVCPSCSAEIVRDARFCSSCGASLDVSSAGTVRRTDSRPSSSGGIDHGRFVPGTMFGERYRIVALLGKGGMGEVYRADDLKLNQAVALKLLPKRFGDNEERRARLLAEVRVARQIAHPNVCRVYDVGEIGGEHFISMEYVQGEDLASLLHRIGRLPKDKGIEIARQICAGLAAAHERGVLHRDLKPANIMLDERGRARVTDFGLASAAGDAANAAEGTPAYMAPEQLAGREVTARSDIYALGLVLYEIFTGRRAFKASSLAELREQREHKSLTDPSRIVNDIDTAVERAILRCLENDPRERPASVVAMMAALPGGDPLAAALAAGETPSPELLAAAGESVGLKPSIAVPLFLFVIVGALVVLLMKWRTDMPSYADLDLPPDALSLKAQEIARQFGYTEKAVDSAAAFELNGQITRYIRDHDRSPNRWEQLRRLPVVRFWYRDANEPLLWKDFFEGRITRSDPPLDRSGMKLIVLDPSGRLLAFTAVPEQVESTPATGSAIDARPIFAAAGLDASQFKAVQPKWVPPVWADWRGAWEGTGANGKPLRVEAAAYHGRLVSFDEISPWTRPSRMESAPLRAGEAVATWLSMVLFWSILTAAAFFARRNVSLGRGDRRGAMRVAFTVFLLVLATNLLGSMHVALAAEMRIVALAISWALFAGAVLWLFYLACEPYVRRRWPHALIGLGKVLSGRFRDPLVGRDVLIGSAAGVALSIVWTGTPILTRFFGGTTGVPSMNSAALSGLRWADAQILSGSIYGFFFAFVGTMLLLLFRVLLRREWLAIALLLFIAGVYGAETNANAVLGAATLVAAWGLLVLTLARFGLLAAALVVTTSTWLPDAVVVSFTGWAAYTAWIPLVVVIVVGGFAFYVSLAGRPLLGDVLLET